MTELRMHEVSTDVFDELASGGGGPAVITQLAAAQRSKHVLLVRGVMTTARATGHPDAGLARRAFDLLAAIEHSDPASVDRALRHPSVGAWARHTVDALETGRAGANPGQLAAIAATAAIVSGTECDIDVPAPEGVVTLPSLGQAMLPPTVTTATVHSHPAGAEISAAGTVIRIPANPGGDAPGWRGLRTLTTESSGTPIRFTVDDLDPFRMPGSPNLAGRLSAAEFAQWQAVLPPMWELLVEHHTGVADDVAGAISVLTPLAAPAHGLVSATSRETFGCVALSTPPDACWLALTLAHEVAHAKLSALLDIMDLTKPDDGSRYYAPWREDPRPVPGLLQGVYAHLGVTDFWRRQRTVETGPAEVHANAEFARWRAASRMVAGTILDSGRLTEWGDRFVAQMISQLDAWADESVPEDARLLSWERADQHRTRWRARNS
ncbi:hypothetical protein Acor_33080 [Acrocarpospora corrugata]|uniref:HEXXH motif domain-containing protein n=1 Tax=Acrocarpospora corrugata TaxID=35763 RepID=A0A5M3VXR5_9ACTN|nr:HEXXH motif domain-containing protein [Acrocarpospora corrugata]GES01244.1 hypothetical protein Acor_33080 [Acrocarpospora corrugata]